MRHLIAFFLILIFSVSIAQKPRLIVLTDIGQDPDDQQSMVRLHHYANEYQIEGLIATADNNYEHEAAEIRDDILHQLVDDYEKSWPNFIAHAKGFPKAEEIRKTIKKGNNLGGTDVAVETFIGEGFDTEGSDWIINVVDKENEQNVCISVWGGACDLAQALWKVKNTRNENETKMFVKKLRVYFIGKQDASNQWIIDNFPDLWLILALDRGGDKWQSGYRGMLWGGDMSNTSKEWIHQNIHGHSALADNYPDHAYTGGEQKNPHMALKEGDTPALLYFIQNGLNFPENPEYGGWGGRFSKERPNFFRDADDTFFDVSVNKEITSPRASVFRWRKDFQNDFAARVDWGSTPDFKAVNHPPQIKLNKNMSKEALKVLIPAGRKFLIDASGTTDPDGNELTFERFEYKEAGKCPEKINIEFPEKGKARFSIPENNHTCESHIILKVTDNGNPQLSSYLRIILQNK